MWHEVMITGDGLVVVAGQCSVSLVRAVGGGVRWDSWGGEGKDG